VANDEHHSVVLIVIVAMKTHRREFRIILEQMSGLVVDRNYVRILQITDFNGAVELSYSSKRWIVIFTAGQWKLNNTFAYILFLGSVLPCYMR
jgi:hypothetical protein